MVFDSVISASFKYFGDFSPFVVDDSVHEEENPLFLLAPIDLLYHWVQVVVPALTALLADAIREMLCNQRPLLRAIALDELEDSPVFFSSPRTFNRIKF